MGMPENRTPSNPIILSYYPESNHEGYPIVLSSWRDIVSFLQVQPLIKRPQDLDTQCKAVTVHLAALAKTRAAWPRIK